MKKMAELSSGSLVKFLQEMHVDGIANTLQDDDKPVLLQIRSIIPVLREGDYLWPNQGFFLRVSDLSHAIYVSLPQEQDDMVLYDKLHIGQFLYVERLEAAYPVPLLKGIRPIPGRHPCLGNPKDIIPMHNLEKFLGFTKLESINEEHDDYDVIKKTVESPQSLTDSKARLNDMIKEKQREKSLCTSSNEVCTDEGIIKTGGLSWKSEEKNDLIKEEKKQTENSRSLNDSRGSSNEVIKTLAEINDKLKKKQAEKSRSFGASRTGSLNESIGRRTSSIYRPRKSDAESTSSYRTKRNDAESYYKGLRKHKQRYGYKDSDMESTVSATSAQPMFKRRSWNGKEATRIAEIPDTPVVKHEVKPDGSSASVSGSSAHSSRNDSSDDNSSSIPKKNVTSIPAKLPTIPSKSHIPTIEKTGPEVTYQRETLSSMNDQISTDINISWDFLPSSLVKLGQELLRQRDIALLASVEALLDASASDRLLKCLSIYSDILSAKEDEHHHPSLERFFSLENNLDRTKLMFQSITGIIPPRKANTDPSTLDSAGEEIKLALDRKQNATEWIKAALESDLDPVSDHIKTIDIPILATNAPKIPTKTSPGNIPKAPLTLRKQRSNIELHAGMAPEMENRQEWIKGRSLPISVELANSLDKESRTWFLSYVEDYLDWVSSKSCSSESDSQVPGNMYKIKKVSDWLDMTCKDKSTLQGFELDACGRVRNKIYGILMKHVERTTMSGAIAES
ncbi:uncharacterized protein LOC8272271 isoform X1 [Ricinus communis]|uniref:uncharacterized protein LOC8272271 isoform X1 n=1 Tax=Ricinus communis TaxID=3988 RepID=UPI00201B0E4A|nr:uncharacterized protein LOC8272271 isoform X1 [Ricinus communis]